MDYDAAARHAPALRLTLLATAAAAAAAAGPGLGRLWGPRSGAAGGDGRAGEEGAGDEGAARRTSKRRAGARAEGDADAARGAGGPGREGWLQCQNKGCRRWARPPPNLSARTAAATAVGCPHAPAEAVAGPRGAGGCDGPAAADGPAPASAGAAGAAASGGPGPFYCRRRCALEAQAFDAE